MTGQVSNFLVGREEPPVAKVGEIASVKTKPAFTPSAYFNDLAQFRMPFFGGGARLRGKSMT
jgi:hypothetical protein